MLKRGVTLIHLLFLSPSHTHTPDTATFHGYIQESAYFDSRFMISLSFSRETAPTSVDLASVHTLLLPQWAAEGEPILKAGCYPHLYPITTQPERLNTRTSKPRQPWCQLLPLNKSPAVVSRFPGLGYPVSSQVLRDKKAYAHETTFLHWRFQ